MPRSDRTIDVISFTFNFLKAVLAAAAVFDLVTFTNMLASVWQKVSWQIIQSDLVMPIVTFPFIVLAAIGLTILPAWLAVWADAKWGLGGRPYYASIGALAGIVAFCFYLIWARSVFGAEDDDGIFVPFLTPFVERAWLAGLSGIVGGLVFCGRSSLDDGEI